MNVSKAACDDRTVSFSLTFTEKMDGGASLEVWNTDKTTSLTRYGRFDMPGSWFQWVTAAIVGSQELYVGEQNFTITKVVDQRI